MNNQELIKNSVLKKTVLDQIIDIIIHHKPVEKIFLFGSRAQNKATRTSDIDIAIAGKNWTSTDINLVLDRMEETIPIIYKFDLVHYDSLQSEILKKEINNGISIYARKN